jgi:DNA polymerase-3 subunit delta'
MQLADYPWLIEAKANVGRSLPPALLIHGIEGIGKNVLATYLGQSTLCEQTSSLDDPCGRCPSCDLFKAETHPDFKLLTNDEDDSSAAESGSSTSKKSKSVISVKSVRNLGTFCVTKPHRGHAKVIIIDPAENLNQSASNALLKNIEEPAEFLHFILIAKHKETLIPTLLSRCLKVHARPPDAKEASEWITTHSEGIIKDKLKMQLAINLSGNAPLASLKLIDDDEFFVTRDKILSFLSQNQIDIFALATLCEKIETSTLQTIFYALLHDLMLSGHKEESLFHEDKKTEIRQIRRSITPNAFSRWQSVFNDYLKSANHPLNRRLALEALFLKWPQT